MKLNAILAGIVILLGLALQARLGVETVAEAKIPLGDLVQFVQSTVNEVEQRSGTATVPEFRHADISLSSTESTAVGTSGTFVVIGGKTQATSTRSTSITARVVPIDQPVSNELPELAATIIAAAKEVREAAGSDFGLSSLTVSVELSVKASAVGKSELSVGDIKFGSSAEIQNSGGNKIVFVFRG